MKCTKDYTLIYSQPSIEALENLFDELKHAFGLPYELSDVFDYGVFCKPETYYNFKFSVDMVYDFDIPQILIGDCARPNEKFEFIRMIMKQVINKEITKPKWMVYVEMNDTANEYAEAPSTFLYLIAKDKIYEELGKKLIDFLYSPNLVIKYIDYEI